MYNKKLLLTVLNDLNKTKAPVKKRDVDYMSPDSMNPILGTPQMKKGGSKKFSKHLGATNRLFKKNPLFKKPNYKSKTYDPQAMYFEDGGYIDAELTPEEIEQCRKGGYIVEDISVPSLNTYAEGGNNADCLPGYKWNGKDCVKDIFMQGLISKIKQGNESKKPVPALVRKAPTAPIQNHSSGTFPSATEIKKQKEKEKERNKVQNLKEFTIEDLPQWAKDRDKYGVDEISWYETVNPKKWGLNDYSEYSSYNSAFRNAREADEKEFVYKGERYNTNLVPKEQSDLYWESKNFLKDYYKTQPFIKSPGDTMISDITSYQKEKYGITATELMSKGSSNLSAVENKLLTEMIDEETKLLSEQSNNEAYYNSDLFNQLRKERIKKLDKPTYFSITTQKPADLEAEGYWNEKKNKMFINAKNKTLNTTYIHELSHKGDDSYEAYESIPKIDMNKFNKENQRTSNWSQKDFEYFSEPTEIESRKLSTLFYLNKNKKSWKAGKITKNSLIDLYNNINKLPFDVRQLLQLYDAQQDDLLKYLNSEYTYKKEEGGSLDTYAGGGSSKGCPAGTYWNGTKCTKLVTLKNDKKYIDGVANWGMHVSDPNMISGNYNDQIKDRLYSGKWGLDPESGALVRLDKIQPQSVTKVDDQTKASREKEKLTEKNYNADIENKEAYKQSIEQAGFDPATFGKAKGTNVITGEPIYASSKEEADRINQEAINQAAIEGNAAVVNNPVFKAAAYMTPVGMAIGAMEGAARLAPDVYDFAKDPSWSGAGQIAMDIAQTTPFAKPIANTVKSTVQNTYKINPWAFKPKADAYYHRSPNLENIVNKDENILQGFAKSEEGAAYSKNRLQANGEYVRPANEQLYFSKGVPLDKGRYNTTGNVAKGHVNVDYPGPYIAEVEGVPMGVSVSGRAPAANAPTELGDYAVSHRPISLDETKFYKEHWLKGYTPVDKSKVLANVPDKPLKAVVSDDAIGVPEFQWNQMSDFHKNAYKQRYGDKISIMPDEEYSIWSQKPEVQAAARNRTAQEKAARETARELSEQKQGGSTDDYIEIDISDLQLGDEIDEDTMNELKRLGYTFEEI